MEESGFSLDARELVKAHAGEPVLVGNFVVLAEITDENGKRGVFVAHNEDIPEWSEVGLLQWRLMGIQSEGHLIIADEEEEYE
jgi:hypothetical protein